MHPITSASGLKSAIQTLNVEQTIKKEQLMRQFDLTFQKFKPVHLVDDFLNDIVSTPHLVNKVLATAVGLATGYLSKKVFIGTSGNLLRKLVGSALQIGVTSVIARHPDATKLIGKHILQYFFRKKEMKYIKS